MVQMMKLYLLMEKTNPTTLNHPMTKTSLDLSINISKLKSTKKLIRALSVR